MSVFNSLGSNYSSAVIKKSLGLGSSKSSTELRGLLSRHYSADSVTLTQKGREAIYLILKNLDLPTHGFIAVNGYTCYAVYDAIVSAGFTPYYIDVEKGKLNFSARDLDKALRKEPDIVAVMVQNTLGYACEIDNIAAICKNRRVPLIEDLAHSLGLKYENRKEAGSMGVAAALSFSQDKVADAVSGGAVVWHGGDKFLSQLNKVEFGQKFKDRIYPISTKLIRSTHSWGLGKFIHKIMSSLKLLSKPMDGNAAIPRKMTNWNAGLALESLKELPKTLDHRKQIAGIYEKNLPKEIQIDSSRGASFIRFPILVGARSDLIEHLKEASIFVSDVWYDAPVSPEYCMPDTNYDGECPNAEWTSNHMLNLPTHINVSEDQAKEIAAIVTEWVKNHGKS